MIVAGLAFCLTGCLGKPPILKETEVFGDVPFTQRKKPRLPKQPVSMGELRSSYGDAVIYAVELEKVICYSFLRWNQAIETASGGKNQLLRINEDKFTLPAFCP